MRQQWAGPTHWWGAICADPACLFEKSFEMKDIHRHLTNSYGWIQLQRLETLMEIGLKTQTVNSLAPKWLGVLSPCSHPQKTPGYVPNAIFPAVPAADRVTWASPTLSLRGPQGLSFMEVYFLSVVSWIYCLGAVLQPSSEPQQIDKSTPCSAASACSPEGSLSYL